MLSFISEADAHIAGFTILFISRHCQNMHFANQTGSDPVFFMGKVKMRLEVEPELGRDAEIPSQSQGRVGRNAPVAMNDFIDSPGRHADVICQPVLGNAHWLQKLLHEHFARMDGRYFFISHINSLRKLLAVRERLRCLEITISRMFSRNVIPAKSGNPVLVSTGGWIPIFMGMTPLFHNDAFWRQVKYA